MSAATDATNVVEENLSKELEVNCVTEAQWQLPTLCWVVVYQRTLMYRTSWQ